MNKLNKLDYKKLQHDVRVNIWEQLRLNNYSLEDELVFRHVIERCILYFVDIYEKCKTSNMIISSFKQADILLNKIYIIQELKQQKLNDEMFLFQHLEPVESQLVSYRVHMDVSHIRVVIHKFNSSNEILFKKWKYY